MNENELIDAAIGYTKSAESSYLRGEDPRETLSRVRSQLRALRRKLAEKSVLV
jgi:hypothetical protein